MTFEGIPAELHGRIVVALELLDSTNDESFEAAIESAYEYIGKDDKDLDSIAQLLDEFKQRATK